MGKQIKDIFPSELYEKYPNVDLAFIIKRLEKAMSQKSFRSTLNAIFDTKIQSYPDEVYDYLSDFFHGISIIAERWGLARFSGERLHEIIKESGLSRESLFCYLGNPYRKVEDNLFLFNDSFSVEAANTLLDLLPEEELTNGFLSLMLDKTNKEREYSILSQDPISRSDVKPLIARIARKLYSYDENIPDEWILQILEEDSK